MSEALAATPTPVGAHVAGMDGGQPLCAACKHAHRRALDESLIFDAACGCGCKASGRVYDHGAPDILDYANVNDYLPARCEHHDLPLAGPCGADDHDGPSDGPRCLPSPERGQLGGRTSVRGHAVDGDGSAVRGGIGHDASDVGELRRAGLRPGRGRGDSRTADDDREQDRTAAVLGYASGWLSRMVSLGRRGWWA